MEKKSKKQMREYVENLSNKLSLLGYNVVIANDWAIIVQYRSKITGERELGFMLVDSVDKKVHAVHSITMSKHFLIIQKHIYNRSSKSILVVNSLGKFVEYQNKIVYLPETANEMNDPIDIGDRITDCRFNDTKFVGVEDASDRTQIEILNLVLNSYKINDYRNMEKNNSRIEPTMYLELRKDGSKQTIVGLTDDDYRTFELSTDFKDRRIKK